MCNQHNASGKKGPVQFSETDDLLDIRYDDVFKAVFTRDTPESKGAISNLISALIEKTVTVQTILANEPPMESRTGRKIRFDINCKTETGQLVNVEMFLHPRLNEKVRLEYLASRLFGRQEIQGIDKNYSDLKETYQISILANEQYFHNEHLVHTLFDRSGKRGIINEIIQLKYVLDRNNDMYIARQEGMQNEIQQGRMETARNALAKGLSIELIHGITGLDLETIKTLQASGR